MQSMKESAANIGASAKAGMEKTKATVQEKAERMTAHDPLQKEMATERKEQKKTEAELNKHEARERNAAAKQATGVGGHNPGYTADGFSHSVTGHQMSAAQPGYGTGQPAGRVTEGVVGSHPIGANTGTGHNPAHNQRVEGQGGATGYGSGGAYT